VTRLRNPITEHLLLLGRTSAHKKASRLRGAWSQLAESPSLSPVRGWVPPFQMYTVLAFGVVFDNPRLPGDALRATPVAVRPPRPQTERSSACPSAKPQVRRSHEIGRVKFRDRDRWPELINFRGHPQNDRPVDRSGPFGRRRTIDGRSTDAGLGRLNTRSPSTADGQRTVAE
jgi:hypothetical protein